MSLVDTNAVLRAYLVNLVLPPVPFVQPLYVLVGDRVYCPRLPENATLPAVGFFTRGGASTPYIPDIPTPSVQFDCWAQSPIEAREVYRLLYDALQGLQNQPVAIGLVDYYILSAREEVQGQDLMDIDIPDKFRVLTFFEIKFR